MKVIVCIALLAVSQALAGPAHGYPKYRPGFESLRERWAEIGAPAKQSAPTIPRATVAKDFRDTCGVKPTKIVGGVEATPNEFPWVCALFIEGGSFCTCSLIGDEWVMTAAHCADGAAYFDIMFGAHNVRLSSEPNRVEVRATEKFVHPNWNPNRLSGDMALIRLPAPLELNTYMSPICLPPSTEPNHEGDDIVMAGWGRPSDNSFSISPVLRKTTSFVVPNSECRSVYGSIIDATIICTSVEAGSGTCNGDSGGPLSFVETDGRYTAVGVTSFVSSLGCEYGLPDGFARVSSYADWIAETTGMVL